MSTSAKRTVDRTKSNDPGTICAAEGESIEFFFASDCAAMIEHTQKFVHLEDNDVVSVKDGRLVVTHRGLIAYR